MASKVDTPREGTFYAKGRTVFRSPIHRKTGNGTTITVGFEVCHVSEQASEATADVIAVGLNELLKSGVIE